MDGPTLTGRLLVATPLIGDPTFHQTVVLLLAHGPGGALGLVLNRPGSAPADEVLLGELDVRADWGEHLAAPGVIFEGGPVDTEGLVGLSADGLVDLRLAPPVTGAPEVRVFAGQAGWAPDQLEGEIGEQAWWVVEPEPDDLVSRDPSGLWPRVLRRQRRPLAWFANHPEDLSTG